MAKPKVDFKKLLLEKGEKYGMIGGVVLMALLIIWGIMTAAGSAGTTDMAKSLTEAATRLKTTVNSKTATTKPDPLEPGLMSVVKFDPIAPDKHINDPYFIDLVLDSLKRGSPRVLSPIEYQADFFRGVIYSYNFVKGADGELSKIYVLKERAKTANKGIDKTGDRYKGTKAGRPASRGPMGGGPGAGGPMGGAGAGGPGGGRPGGPGGFGSGGGFGPGGPGGPGGGFGPGGPGGGFGPGGPGGGFGPGGPGGMGGVASADTLRTLEVVEMKEYLDPTKSYIPAQFVRPLQAVIVQAAFPWRQQLEEYQKALRYNTLQELMANQADLPRFEGFKVQRRVHFSNGQTSEWADHDWVEKYDPIYREKIDEDQLERADLQIVTPPEDTELFIPLPKLARGKYPDLNLASVRQTIEKAKSSNNQQMQGGWGNRGSENRSSPFSRGGGNKLQEKKDDKKSDKASDQIHVPEVALMRFIDVDVVPGNGYEYRVQVRLANPNYGKKNLVSRPDHATEKQLLGEPSLVAFKEGDQNASIVKAPVDRYVFAYAPETRETLKADHARVQVHSWLSHVRPDRTRPMDATNSEPLGDWVVEDLQVGRGQPVLGLKNVKVPIWSAEKSTFQFMEFASAKSAGARLKGALPIDISAPQLLVDFEGHPRRTETVRAGKSFRDVTDEAGLELLLLGADGKLRVRTYWNDMVNAERYERESHWTGWLKTVRDAASNQGGSRPGDPFDKGGTTGGPKG